MPKDAMKNAEEAMKMCELYLRTECKLNEVEVFIAVLWIKDFIITSHRREWPIASSQFPDILRALAVTLEKLYAGVE